MLLASFSFPTFFRFSMIMSCEVLVNLMANKSSCKIYFQIYLSISLFLITNFAV